MLVVPSEITTQIADKMQIKHFFDDATVLVHSALNSLTITNPSLAFDKENKIIYRRPQKDASPKVSIISGGGSGHEPGFAGFVGKGFLTASVAGTIFASPSAEQVRRAVLTRVPTEKGVLVITMNYTGDVLNFGMAAEKAKAGGVATEFYAIGDDVGVGRAKGGKVGRRGIGGGILLLKIVGALAEKGGSLTEVYELAKQVNRNLVSLGSSLERVHVPGREVPKDDEGVIPYGEIEVGMGIHNEPGSKRVKASLPELVKIMLAELLDPKDEDRHYTNITKDDKVVLFMNNLGATSMLEFAGATNECVRQLKEDYGLTPVRVITGTFLTSLDGLGWSASILRLEDTGLGGGKSMLELIDAPAEAVGWANTGVATSTWNDDHSATFEHSASDTTDTSKSNLTLDPAQASKALKAGLKRMAAAEPDVTRYDTIVGDGDCGIGLKRGAEAVTKELDSGNLPTDAVAFLGKIIPIVENTMDGTSGAIYAIFLNALAYGLRSQDNGSQQQVDAQVWAKACKSAMEDLAKYTPAAPGDRTLMDSLVPFVDTLSKGGSVKDAAAASRKGAEETKSMKASLGRAVYVGSEQEWMGKIPDPGAWGLAEFFDGLAEAST